MLDSEGRNDLERAKELFSNTKHDMKWSEVIAHALKIALDCKDPLRKKSVTHEQALKVQHAQHAKPISSSQKKPSHQTNQCRSQLVNQNQNAQNQTTLNSNLDSKSTASQNPCEMHHAITQGSTGVGSRIERKPQQAQVRRYILQRDGGACTYRNSKTGRICGSRHQIEIDHIVPVALGGTNAVENLRCLCRRHNQLRAERTFARLRISGRLRV